MSPSNPPTQLGVSSVAAHAKPLFTDQTDLVPIYLLRFDRENTRRAYARDLETFFGMPLVTMEMARLVTFVHVNAYLAALEADGKSVATLRRHLACLRGFFSWLIALGSLSHNPADRHLVRRIAPDRARDRTLTVLTREQARQMLETVDLGREKGPRDHALVLTLLHCVLRRSEAALMDVEHIRQVGGHWVLDLPHTKGGANQTVKIPQHVAQAIQESLTFYGITTGPVWRSFSNNGSRGKRLSPTSIYMIVNRLAVASGISGLVGAHTLRHTGCTLAIEGGASVQQVQTHARHKNIETTMIYVHQRDRLANSAADFIGL